MKKISGVIVIVIMLLWNCFASAQVINGVVCDENTKQPVANVHVYFDGTSINTITNASGRFELRTTSEFNTRLVLHHLLYETAIFNNPFARLPDTLFIKERIYELPEITVSADLFTREQKMKAFREQFLGVSRAGKSCVIENEDDIQLFFNMQTRRLLASSEKPIVVVNNYLGYKVSFILVDFWAQYYSAIVSLKSDNIQSSFFAVVSSFIDLNPNNRRIKQRRDNLYELSTNFFFKSFATDSLKENKFTLFNKQFSIDPQLYFTIKDTLMQTMISIIPGTDLNKVKTFQSGTITMREVNSDPEMSGVISVINPRKNQSDIYFRTDSFLVDRYGNIKEIDKISFSGQMGELRAGDMLPIDYEPSL